MLGLSGSGKSSLIFAGLIPALLEGRLLEPGLRWRIATAKPRGTPFANLASSLGCAPEELRSTSHGLIEYARGPACRGRALRTDRSVRRMFRYKDRAVGPLSLTSAASEAGAFVDLLIASARSALPIYFVITMRTEYLGEGAEFPDFPEVLNESQYLIPRLTREQRRQAIEGPLGPFGSFRARGSHSE